MIGPLARIGQWRSRIFCKGRSGASRIFGQDRAERCMLFVKDMREVEQDLWQG